jgi:hypothetical protein
LNFFDDVIYIVIYIVTVGPFFFGIIYSGNSGSPSSLSASNLCFLDDPSSLVIESFGVDFEVFLFYVFSNCCGFCVIGDFTD